MTQSIRIVSSNDNPNIYVALYVRAFSRSVICAFAVLRTCPLYGLVPLYCSSLYSDLLVNEMIALLFPVTS